MYMGSSSLQLAEMELAERRQKAERFRMVRETREEWGMPRVHGLAAILDGLRAGGSIQRLTRVFRPA
jgi:hypothetical protein